MENKHHSTYRPDIDGLRAFAILSVIIYHTFPKFISGGFIGVDVFFVISGFLISSIIFKTIEENEFSYLEFYTRRIKRIFPALIIVVFSTIVIGWFILLPNEFTNLGKNIVAGAIFISNIASWKEVGYFNTSAELKPLLHLWSLGVEEQYYIVWPILATLIWKKTNNKNSFSIILVVITLSFSINVFFMNIRPEATFYLPASRFWELMIGSLLALPNLHKIGFLNKNFIKNILSLSGLLLLLIGLLLIDETKKFPGYWALLPTGGAFLIILAGKTAWVNSTILSNRVLIFIGLISYPLYLWHWPLLAYSKIVDLTGPYQKATILLISFILAYLTYKFIERPVRIGRKNYSLILISLMTSILILGLLIFYGFIHTFHNNEDINKISQASGEWNFPGKMTPFKFNNRVFYRISDHRLTATDDEVVFFGDSNMQMYYPNINNLSRDSSKSITFATQGGCPPIPNVYKDQHRECNNFVDDVMSYISKSSVKTIVIGAQWYGYLRKESNYYIRHGNSKKYSLGKPLGKKHAMTSLETLLKKLQRMKKTTYLVLNIPIGKALNPKYMINRSLNNKNLFFSTTYENLSMNELLKYKNLDISIISASQATKTTIIDPKKHLCKDGSCPSISKSGELIYKDGSHLRPSFVRDQINFLDEVMKDSIQTFKTKSH